MSRSAPLRFLALLLAGWAGSRAAWLAPAWWPRPAEAARAPQPAGGGPAGLREQARAAVQPRPGGKAAPAPPRSPDRPAPLPRPRPARHAEEEAPWTSLSWRLAPRERSGRGRAAARGIGPPAPAGTAPPRWSFATWAFLRSGEASALVPGGTLGGSQAGAVARFRLNRDAARPLALAMRLSSPIRRRAGAEAAVGIDWQPSRRIPLHILAERRQGLGREGRSAFGLTLYGGIDDAPLAGLRVDAYAQAGIVGSRSRDLFGDGALRLSLPLGRARLGAGAWAAAQPGVARLDIGPQASVRLPLAGRNFAVAADWRLRAAGGARPGSGPTLTIATDF